MILPDHSAIYMRAACVWIIMNQFGRRNLSMFTRAELALKLEPLLKAKAKERQGTRTDLPKNSWESTEGMHWDQRQRLADNEKLKAGREIRRKNMAESMQVYVAITGSKIKVGVSADPEGRLTQLRTSDPDIELVSFHPGGKKIEAAVLKKFASNSIGGEWFSKTEDLLSSICAFVKKESRRANETGIELAKAAGVSHDTLTKARVIAAKASEEVKAALRAGETTINAEHKKLTVHVSHNSGENEWYTPAPFIAAARAAMETNDCDRVSYELAAEAVGAKQFFAAQ